MTEQICEFSDLPADQCGHCRAPRVRVASAQAKPVRTGPTIAASHDSPCGWCGQAMETGELISYTDEEGWCHEDCTEPPQGSQPPETPEGMWA